MTNEAEAAIRALQGASENAEEALWRAVVACQGLPFRTATGLPFTYCLKIGQNGQPNRELLIDRREKSKTLSWSSVCLAFRRAREIGYADRPKALGDIRGVSYVYPLLWRVGGAGVAGTRNRKSWRKTCRSPSSLGSFAI